MTHRRAAAPPRRAVSVYSDRAMAEKVAAGRASDTVATEVVAEARGFAAISRPKPPAPRPARKPRAAPEMSAGGPYPAAAEATDTAAAPRAARKKES